ncbi:MAG: hypothetical protein OEV40_08245 [Acidimicrobiia bacterium]|nr:hypothetical protein [Acidimicrobiia bacterium]
MKSRVIALAVPIALCAIVSACTNGGESTEPPAATADRIDLDELEAAAIVRLVTVDNSFGPEAEPFDRIIIGTRVEGDVNQPLRPLASDLMTAALDRYGPITFVDDVDATIDELFRQNATGTAVASIDDLRVEGERAELDMRLWCGSLCGVFLTYEAELTDAGWEILGTTGPIAVS